MAPIGMIENDVASSLVVEPEAGLLKGFDRFPARDNRKDGH